MKTFESPIEGTSGTLDDGLGTSGRSRGLRVDDGLDNTQESLKPIEKPAKPAKPANNNATEGNSDSVIPSRSKAPAKDAFEDEFEKPLENNKDGNGEAQIRLPLPKINLDDKIVWQTEATHTRIPFHAKVARATVARRGTSTEAEWTPVVAKAPRGPQLVKK